MKNLLAISADQRDENWQNKFFELIIHETVSLKSEIPETGPDTWPYIIVATEDKGSEPITNIMKWCADNGVGLALNVDQEFPDYVFTFGMLWNFVHNGYFITPESIFSQQEELNESENLLTGPPTEAFLPPEVRNILKEFFQQQGINSMKTLLIKEPGESIFDLCFSLECLNDPPEEEQENLLEALSWFFPRHYTLALGQEALVAAPFMEL